MSQKFEKLKTLLMELFQLDKPDLDFGIYRVMHAKSAEVTRFLDKDLLPQVSAVFSHYQTADKAEIEKELAKAMEQAQALGADPETLPKVKDLRARLANEAVDIGSLEGEVYDHLFSFFRRYYDQGDFLAKRVYKPGVYAIPYEGEEVTLHWANKDQYYIKTSEYLSDYAFRLRPDDDQQPMRVHFRLADAVEGEHGNVKAAEGQNRVFILAAPGASGQDFMTEEDGEQGKELAIRFLYRPATLTDWPDDEREGKKKPPVQKELIAFAVKRVLAITDCSLAPWISQLGRLAPTEKELDRTILQKHITKYSDINKFDFFIHKDLGTFLRRELDFFIKNEVMHLDDVEQETAPRVEQYLSKIKVIRKIAGKIIAFLAQLEDFQKKLWLKIKFVVETTWCITVGCIPEDFYTEICANEAQHQEWVELFAIDQIKADLTRPGYSIKLTNEFLKAHPTLVVDTLHFDGSFTARILEAVGNLDDLVDGVLLHGENFNALKLIKSRYSNSIECIFSDPPYNTGLGDFVYKDNFQHSSWMTMIYDRYSLAASLLRHDGACWTTLDNNEANNFQKVADIVFKADCFVDTVAWKDCIGWEKVYSPRMDAKQFSSSIDFIFVYSGQPSWSPKHLKIEPNLDQFPHTAKDGRRYRSDPLRKWGKNSLRTDRQKLWFSIRSPNGIDIWPIKPDGTEGCWRWQKSTVASRYAELDWLDKGNGLQPYVRQYAESSDWRPVETLWNHEEVGSTHEAAEELKALIPGNNFKTIKPTRLVERALASSGDEYSTLLDFFSGSGTSGHSVINMNRDDGGRRRFILAEMGDHFDTLLLCRIKKAVFSPEWRIGKPKRLATPKEAERSPRIVKVVRLESYEDTLNNLETLRTKEQQGLLNLAQAQGPEGLKEQYILRYMLDVETRGSQSLLNVQAFTDPTGYKLKVKRPGSDESRVVNVDLLETFNWLIGLTVKSIAAPQTFVAPFERDSEQRLCLAGRLKQESDGPFWFRTVTGTTPDGRRTLIIWRKLTGEAEQDNLILDEWFTKQGYSAKDSEFDLIYVNGGNNLENLKTADDLWKVRLIEEDFHRLMFEVEGA